MEILPAGPAREHANQSPALAVAPHLLSISIDGDGLVGECLCHKVADHTPVIQRHAGPIGVEDPDNAHLQQTGQHALHAIY